MTNIDHKAPLPTAKESADERACLLHTHMQHDSDRQMTSMQRTCGQNHMKADLLNKSILLYHCTIYTRVYNSVCNRIN
jgi:hypothetical protein